MNGNTLASSDVSDDFFTTNGVAALGAIDEQFIETCDFELGIPSDAEHLLDCAGEAVLTIWRLVACSIRHKPGNNLLGGDPSVADRGQHIPVSYTHLTLPTSDLV